MVAKKFEGDVEWHRDVYKKVREVDLMHFLMRYGLPNMTVTGL